MLWPFVIIYMMQANCFCRTGPSIIFHCLIWKCNSLLFIINPHKIMALTFTNNDLLSSLGFMEILVVRAVNCVHDLRFNKTHFKMAPILAQSYIKNKQMENKSVIWCERSTTILGINVWHKTIFYDYLCTVGGGHDCWGSCGPACWSWCWFGCSAVAEAGLAGCCHSYSGRSYRARSGWGGAGNASVVTNSFEHMEVEMGLLEFNLFSLNH